MLVCHPEDEQRSSEEYVLPEPGMYMAYIV
jgi:hypothetical protein